MATHDDVTIEVSVKSRATYEFEKLMKPIILKIMKESRARSGIL